jgi:hypothetical protein
MGAVVSEPVQLRELIPVRTPLGSGYAIIFEAGEHDNYWTVALDDTCALVTFRQQDIKIGRSYTHRRALGDKEMKRIIKRSV